MENHQGTYLPLFRPRNFQTTSFAKLILLPATVRRRHGLNEVYNLTKVWKDLFMYIAVKRENGLLFQSDDGSQEEHGHTFSVIQIYTVVSLVISGSIRNALSVELLS
jgi:hypothetical protein